MRVEVNKRRLKGEVAELSVCYDPCLQAARSQGVDCLVAPYEADAQLAYLNKAGIVQAIITEDSDLLAFGCKKVLICNYVILIDGGSVKHEPKGFPVQEEVFKIKRTPIFVILMIYYSIIIISYNIIYSSIICHICAMCFV